MDRTERTRKTSYDAFEICNPKIAPRNRRAPCEAWKDRAAQPPRAVRSLE
jgi:hypothetical protein